MPHRPEWFAPKSHGYGSGLPISWQGWVITLGYVAVVLVTSVLLRQRPLQLFAVVIPLTLMLMVVCALTTRGGWRWRWGEDD
jgi:hypothetical protein